MCVGYCRNGFPIKLNHANALGTLEQFWCEHALRRHLS